MAHEVAKDMVKEKTADLEKAEKEPISQGKTPAEKIAARKAHKAKIEQAKQELEHWKAIANVQAERKAETERQEAEKVKAEEAKEVAEAKTEETKKVDEGSNTQQESEEKQVADKDFSAKTEDSKEAYKRLNEKVYNLGRELGKRITKGENTKDVEKRIADALKEATDKNLEDTLWDLENNVEKNPTVDIATKLVKAEIKRRKGSNNAPKEQRRRRKANTKKASKETVSPSKKRFGDSAVSNDASANVRKKLEDRKNFYKKAPNRTRGFITNVSVDLDLVQHESSHYRTITTKNGKIFTFRISNHNADARTFDEHGETEGISIVISSKKNKGIRGKEEALAHVKEFFYSKKAIENAEENPLATIIESIETMLETGEYVDKTGLAKADNTYVPRQTRRTCESVAKAFGMDVEWVDHMEANGEFATHDENGNKLDRPVIRIAKDAENPLGVVFGHEGTHAVRLLSEESYQSLKDAVKGIISAEEFANRLKDVKERYKDKNLSEDQLEEEVICDIIGETLYKDDMLSDLAFRLNHKVLAKLKDVAQRMWDSIKQLFSKQTLSDEERKMMDYVLTINAAFERAQNVKQAHELQTEEEVRKYSLKRKEEVDEKSRKYYDNHETNISEKVFAKAQSDMDYMAVLMYPYMDATARGNRILPEERYGDGNVRSTIFNNGSYGRTMENTLNCIRTLAYNQFTDAVKTLLGRPLTQRESFLASQMVYDIATDPQCLYCYVSLDRKAYDEFLLRYINERDGVLDKFRALSKKERNIGKAAPHTALQDLHKEFLHSRKDSPNMQKRFDNWIRSEMSGSPMISAKDLATKDTRSTILSGLDKALAAQVKDAEKYAQSASWAKKDVNYISYTGELLGRRMSNRLLKTLLSEYGLRFYSFSEYTPAFILENMQMVRDAALRGLNGLAYTKVVEFAKIFAPTGMNINVSCYGRLDKDGNMVMDTLQGADWELVKELREQYPNVGAVFVATSDKAVEWALNQDWIDVVIPFHIVRTGSDIADFYQWKNHSSLQSEHYIDKPSKTMYVSPVEHHNDKSVFLNVCKERGVTPRFAKWLDNKNYMKLVNETRRSIDETTPLQPIFDMESAEDSWRRFVNMGGYYNNWWQVSPEEYNRCVQRVVDDIREGKEANQVDYGRQDLPANLDKLTAAARRQRQHGNTPLYDVFDPHGNALQQTQETDERVSNSREADERYHKAESVASVSHNEQVLRDAVVDRLNEMNGIPTEMDAEQAQRKLNEEVATDSNVRFHKETDKDTLKHLNEGKTIKVYRAMQVIDGKLYPPMAAMVGGKMVEPNALGEWIRADENPDLAIPDIDSKTGLQKRDSKGELKWKFKLDKGSKDATGKKATSVNAAYNPYWHMSRSPLNDQFKSAWIRPNIVVVECEVPESELTSGYKAERAKDAVGEVDWKSGSVSGEVFKQTGRARKVILSRWCKPVRILSDAEVAQRAKEFVGKANIVIPQNVLTPKQRIAFEEAGFKIGAPEKGVNLTEQIAEALKAGLKVDNNVLNESKPRFFRTADGEAYGFTIGGKIYIDPRIATSETPIHEYAHLWATALRQGNAEEWQNVVGLMKGTSVWDEVKNTYPELKTNDENADEVLAHYSGRRGAERLRAEAKKIADGKGSALEKADAISAIERVKQAINGFWKGVCDFLHIHYTSAEEVADRVMKDLLEGVDPRKFGTDSKQSANKTLVTSGSYFSGGGLLEEGLKGIINPQVAVEFNEKIAGVYADNHGNHIVTADVRNVDPSELIKHIDGEVQYFHASPVCKNFSIAKRNAGEVGIDKETAQSTADFIHAVRPKVVTIENVKGYQRSDSLGVILKALSDEGYTYDVGVYNAADFGGYTHRERLIVRAVRDGLLPEKPSPIDVRLRPKGWMDAVDDLIETLPERNGVPAWMDTRLKGEGIDWHNIDKPLYVFGQGNNPHSVPHAFADETLPALRTGGGDVIIMPDGRVLT